jgi:hypothetical protein
MDTEPALTEALRALGDKPALGLALPQVLGNNQVSIRELSWEDIKPTSMVRLSDEVSIRGADLKNTIIPSRFATNDPYGGAQHSRRVHTIRLKTVWTLVTNPRMTAGRLVAADQASGADVNPDTLGVLPCPTMARYTRCTRALPVASIPGVGTHYGGSVGAL